MQFEIEDKDALARSMMLALAVDRGLPENPEEAIKTLWDFYNMARGELRAIEREKDTLFRDALKGIGDSSSTPQTDRTD